MGVVRFGEPAGRYRELVRTYGFDVTRWKGFPVLRAVRELKLITSVLPILSSRPEVRPEFFRRLADVRRGDDSGQMGPLHLTRSAQLTVHCVVTLRRDRPTMPVDRAVLASPSGQVSDKFTRIG